MDDFLHEMREGFYEVLKDLQNKRFEFSCVKYDCLDSQHSKALDELIEKVRLVWLFDVDFANDEDNH